MRIVFVHGWSVSNTNTYGGLPESLSRLAPPALAIEVQHLHLAKYVSFADEVTVEDIARGMQHAIEAEVRPNLAPGERFACITHSTGGPVVRKWIDLVYRGNLSSCPVGHLILLAPANHGSALAQLGKGRLSRVKSFIADGVEPGVGVLDWLELGSAQSWELNSDWLGYNCVAAGLYPFVLTGQSIDRSLYDNLNSYTDEAGSDGVVRVAAANLNYGKIRMVQRGDALVLDEERVSVPTALGVLPGLSHSGEEMGIMRSVTSAGPKTHPTVKWTLRCLGVSSAESYAGVMDELAKLTATTQAKERVEEVKTGFLFKRTFLRDRYSMLVLRLRDDRGNTLKDYDLLFTAGAKYDPNHLPEGFFVDRQRNSLTPGTLTYYVNHDKLVPSDPRDPMKGKFGLKVVARPGEGFAHYTVAEYRGTFEELSGYLKPNQTLMIDIVLQRHVMEGVFQLTQDLAPQDFRKQAKGDALPDSP
jgi:hypothetical protein